MEKFLSATALVWCGFFSLIMIGVIYLLKKGKDKEKSNQLGKTFILLYIITLTSLLLELVLQHAFPQQFTHPLYPFIVSKIYIFLGMIWNAVVIIYYVLLYRQNKGIEESFEFSRKLNTIFFGIVMVTMTLVLTLPVQYIYDETGFWILGGTLNTVYNRMAIIADAILLIFILIKRKYLPKQLVFYSIVIFVLYITNFVLEGVLDYSIKDSQFIYALFVSALYYTTENQDRKMLEEYNKAKNLSVEVDKQKTKFLLNMSHEIRTPLNTILGYSDYLLLDEHFTKEQIENEGENVYQASETLLSLINNILDISRIESGKETLVEADYKLEDLIFELESKISPKAALRNSVKFNIEVDENLPANYYGDLAKIQRILISILTNAVDCTTLGEVRLKISGVKNGDTVNLTFHIKNSGHAMKEEKFNVNFNDITSLDTADNIDNNILGIIISKRLISLLGGKITFKNEINHGTQYFITLTQKTYGEDHIGNIYEKIRNLKGEKLINCEGKTVLVADDNGINLTIAKRLLVRFGFKVETCLSGQECLNLAREKKYDIIFLDHMMPGMDGIETLNKLKVEHADLCPTIALTANAADDSKNEYMRVGFTDYLTKPIDMKELNKILIRLFEDKE